MKPEEKFLRSLFDVTHIEFQTYDVNNHRLLFSNGMICQLLGYSDKEYFELSKDLYKNIVHPDDFNTVQETIKRVTEAKQGDVFEMTIRLRKHDGDYIWVYSRQMIYETGDKVCTIIREVEDVTSLMELQEQLQQKVAQLEVISYKNSHLLRSPVASITGLVDLIEDHSGLDEHNKQILHFLKEAINKLDTVIHEINDVAKS